MTLESGDRLSKYRKSRMRTLVRRHRQISHLRRQHFFRGRFHGVLEIVKQLLSVQDLNNAVRSRAVGCVDAVLGNSRRDGSVDRNTSDDAFV